MGIVGIDNPYAARTYNRNGTHIIGASRTTQVDTSNRCYTFVIGENAQTGEAAVTQEEIAEKIQNGETELTYQIGSQSFTVKEWNKFIDKIDKDIDAIQPEQKERIKKQQDENMSADNEQSVLSGTTTAFNPNTYSYFGTEGMTVYTKDGTPLAVKALTEQRYTDKKTGISWYVGEDGRPYMLGEIADKFIQMCKENGEFPLKKFAEMTGMIRQLDDNTTAFVRDNGIAVKGKDGREYVIDIAGMSYDNIMSMLSKATGGGDYYSGNYWNNQKSRQ